MSEYPPVVDLVQFYEARGWDWRLAVEYIIRKANGSLPWQENARGRKVRA